jgi:hypothetical protein
MLNRTHQKSLLLSLTLSLSLLARAEEVNVVAPDALQGRVGTPLLVSYTLNWPEGGPYVLLGQELPELEWAEWRVLRTETHSSIDPPQVVVAIELTPLQEGDFELPQLAFDYVEDSEMLDEASPTTVHAAPVPVAVRAAPGPPPLPWLLGGGAAVLLALGMAAFAGVRTSRSTLADQQKPLGERIQDALHVAQRHRLDGDFYAYYQELTRVAELVAADDDKMMANLRRRAQSVGYGGVRPTEDELNGDQRAIERAVARWKEQSVA